MAFRHWLLLHAAGSGRRVINASGAGILFGQGMEIAPLWDDAIRNLDSGRVDARVCEVGLRIGRDVWPLIGLLPR